MAAHVSSLLARRTMVIAARFLLIAVAIPFLEGTSCGPGLPPNGNPDTITADTTLASLSIPAGQTITVMNNAVITVTGDAQIDGKLTAPSGRLTLRVSGAVNLNGMLVAQVTPAPDLSPDMPFDQQDTGIDIVVGQGAVTFGKTAVLQTNGNTIITDDETVLMQKPADLYNEIENVGADSLPTLAPLPPDNTAFQKSARVITAKIANLQQAGGLLPPITVAGTWPPAGMPPPAGDRPVVIMRFNGPRDVNLGDWTVNGPPAPAGAAGNQAANPGNNAAGQSGKNGLGLNIRNNGGAINVTGNVVLNLADGGDGGAASAVCANATGGDGGKAGNLRMSASDGIDLSKGTLTINPGRSGAGGDATVTKGAAAAAGCPGAAGANGTAQAGNAANNQMRLFARGAVVGIANVTIGPLIGGHGGNATATACDGGPGNNCCNGGAGGAATALGGRGGNAALNLSGLPATGGAVLGGDGGDATGTGGNGGNGGDCKFGDGGNGGAGGAATATAGAGGSAANGGGAATGGNGGTATATGGDGGNGGSSGLGKPGTGGAGGNATGTGGAGGTGVPPGSTGPKTETNGKPGKNGGQLPVTLFCFPFLFIASNSGVIPPGEQTGPVFVGTGSTQVGTMAVDFAPVQGAQYLTQNTPVKHIGVGNGGQVSFKASTLHLETNPPGSIGGIRLATLSGQGLSQTQPMTVQALDAGGQVVGTKQLASVPDNQANPQNPETVDVLFPDATGNIAVFVITVPVGDFVTFIEICLLDP